MAVQCLNLIASSFLFSLLLSYLSSPILSHQTLQTKKQASSSINFQRHEHSHLSVPRPYPPLSNGNLLKNKKRRSMRRRKSFSGHYQVGELVFSAMLPRGFVPPSDSSSCHNDAPESINAVHGLLCGDDRRQVSTP
ncbi:uncharacterized protein LOC110098929 [Dendrobium catenatum]|uniref:uncharacterized protein LOC110098929 n=1 Tax=Dendrobium catenatum TaxID=906689 RepID=UPI0009F68678|nr:uncharacterized protein LOC110098929 [Dendrobium catenatum]